MTRSKRKKNTPEFALTWFLPITFALCILVFVFIPYFLTVTEEFQS